MKTFNSIHLPTDFSRGSHTAFEHALRIAIDGQCSLRLVHVGDEESPPWDEFPGIRLTLERWGALPPRSQKEDVLKLGVQVQKFFVPTNDPVKAIVKDVDRKQPDLLVMATHARQGLSRLLHSSICKQVVRQTQLPTLIVPHGAQGLVDSKTGVSQLQRILIPVSPEVQPRLTVELTNRFVYTLKGDLVTARLIYVGNDHEGPALDTADSDRIQWEYVTRDGGVVDELSREIENFRPDLIVMLGRGRDSVLDFLMPGKMERIAGEAGCPLLVQNVAAS
jgi:nucleotide-binding universal stress UspA family protein